MITRRTYSGLLVAYLFFGSSAAQLPSTWKPQDVITYFCSRWYHQCEFMTVCKSKRLIQKAVIKNGILYLYGGIQTFNDPGLNVSSRNNTLGYNPYMLQLDLEQPWDWQQNLSWSALKTTPNPSTGASVRQAMITGAMFHGSYSEPAVWTYGGTIFRGNESFLEAVSPNAFHDQSNIYPLWSFTNDTNTWNQFDIGTLNTPSYGSSAEAPDQGLAFYLHGRTDNGTNIGNKDTGDIQVLLDGMIVIDLVHRSSKNISTASMKDSQPRLGGLLQYIPAIGDKGLLVAMGGKVLDGLQRATSQSRGRLLGFENIDVFDLASYGPTNSNGTWFTQATSGDIPPARIDTCTVLASAPDNSSHNIYMYGGWDPTNGHPKYYDDIYVLSLPSFTWIKLFEGESPRYGHTCHLAAGRQLLTIGGSTQHGNITDSCDWEAESIAVMDLPTMTWGSVYSPTYKPYELSSHLVDKLGGSAQGNATTREPVKGWISTEAKTLMHTTRIYSNLNGTLTVIRPSTETLPLSRQARIAIITSTTVFGTILFGCIAWLLYLKQKRQNSASKRDPVFDSALKPCCEAAEMAKFELSPDEKRIFEMEGDDRMHEATDGTVRVEADRSNTVVSAVELPATNFGDSGRWGVPLVRVSSPAFLTQGVDTKSNIEKHDTLE